MTTTELAGLAGRTTGTAARHLIWLESQIDWQEVGTIVLHGTVTLAVMTYMAGQYTRRAWDALMAFSETMGKAYAALIAPTTATTTDAPAPAPIAPIAHPLAAMAADLERLTVAQLRELTGCRRRCRKAELIALALTV